MVCCALVPFPLRAIETKECREELTQMFARQTLPLEIMARVAGQVLLPLIFYFYPPTFFFPNHMKVEVLNQVLSIQLGVKVRSEEGR